MAKKRKSDVTRLDEVDRSMYSTFCGAASSLSQLYTHGMNQQRLSFQAGERHALEKLYDWILRQQQDGVRVITGDILAYVQARSTGKVCVGMGEARQEDAAAVASCKRWGENGGVRGDSSDGATYHEEVGHKCRWRCKHRISPVDLKIHSEHVGREPQSTPNSCEYRQFGDELRQALIRRADSTGCLSKERLSDVEEKQKLIENPMDSTLPYEIIRYSCWNSNFGNDGQW